MITVMNHLSVKKILSSSNRFKSA